MSVPHRPPDVKLLASIFSAASARIDEAMTAMSEKYGRPDYISEPLAFDYTRYYEKEFGGSLTRRFISFERLIGADELPDVKLWTNAMEKRTAASGKRQVDIDPGYISAAHLILATAKGYAHRPYLRDGIYADLTLIYQKGGFQRLPWSYPDYAAPDTIAMLSRIREKYLLQLRERAAFSRGDGHGD